MLKTTVQNIASNVIDIRKIENESIRNNIELINNENVIFGNGPSGRKVRRLYTAPIGPQILDMSEIIGGSQAQGASEEKGPGHSKGLQKKSVLKTEVKVIKSLKLENMDIYN